MSKRRFWLMVSVLAVGLLAVCASAGLLPDELLAGRAPGDSSKLWVGFRPDGKILP